MCWRAASNSASFPGSRARSAWRRSETMSTHPTRGAELSLRELSVQLGGREILRDIDLHVKPGEFIGIVGRSGSGKSTLLRVLAGLETHSHGELSVGAPPIVMFQE